MNSSSLDKFVRLSSKFIIEDKEEPIIITALIFGSGN